MEANLPRPRSVRRPDPEGAALALDPSLIEGLAELRDETAGDPRIVVAILDGAVDLEHPDFAGGDFVQLPSLASERPTRHGTLVASIAVGKGVGIAPACRGISIPVFQENADGEIQPCAQLDLARAIRQAVEAGARVINVSGGQLAPAGQAEPFLAEAVAYAAAKGALIVAAAGNDGRDCLHVPAALPSVLAVGAVGTDGRPLDFSNWGYAGRGLLAPGQGILGAVPGGGVARRSGTSYATPVVTGVVALLLSRQLERGEAADPQAVRRALLESALACDPRQVPDAARCLAGRLDLRGARRRLEALPAGVLAAGRPEEGQETDPQANPFTTSGSEAGLDEEGGPGAYQSLGGSTEVDDTRDLIHPAQGTEERREPSGGLAPPAVAAAEPGQVAAADCGCGGGHGKPCSCSGGLAYAIGQLGYDLATEARRDSLVQSMGAGNVYVAADLLAHLSAHPWEAEALLWTLNLDATPIYAVRPEGPFAGVAYERLREFLAGQQDEGVERISVPGRVQGKATLFSGQVVPVIVPELRGLYSWSTDALIGSVLGPPPAGEGKKVATYSQASEGVRNFLGRVYYELRNLGQSPEERALNFAATNAFQATRSFQDAVDRGQVLDSVAVERSPICRPGSDCWDVKLIFFNPRERLTQARHVHRFTVDVSDVIPVTVGPVRSWAIY